MKNIKRGFGGCRFAFSKVSGKITIMSLALVSEGLGKEGIKITSSKIGHMKVSLCNVIVIHEDNIG